MNGEIEAQGNGGTEEWRDRGMEGQRNEEMEEWRYGGMNGQVRQT